MSRFYVTTAIDYSNGDPHLGHAFEKIGTDVIARYHRMRGDDVWFLTGMDEHGQKVAQAAAAEAVAPQQLVDRIAERFQAMWERLGISYDQFIRTTNADHRRGAQALIERIFERNPEDFYERAYSGWYCVGCEAFKQDAEIADGRCILHPTRTLEWVAEKNWFFRLSRYREFLLEWHERHREFLQPDVRRNEVLSLLRQGLEDISASRARLEWGVPFPHPTSDGERQSMYVWFDALPNYLTATGFPNARYEERWPAQLHVIGKDITRFHAVIWPAMLRAAELPLPDHIWAHGFIHLGGERFSKSAGVRLDLGEAIDRYGVDAFRYFLLREVPFDADGNFSWERFEDRYTAELANAFGNLASRTIAMIERYCGGLIPAWHRDEQHERDARDIREYVAALDANLLHEGLRIVWRNVSDANEYVDRQAPWKLAKDESQRDALSRTLATLARKLAVQAVLISPYMPAKAQALWQQLGAPDTVDAHRLDVLALAGGRDALEALDPSGWRVTKGPALFPRETPAAAR